MARREFAVFGLGKFGISVAETLAKNGCQVLVVDSNEEKIQEISDVVTYAVKADITDIDVIRTLGISNVDVAIIAIADDLEASIMATIVAKEAGVPYIIAKVQSEVHATVLKKVGADEIIFPERAMGARVARNLMEGNFVDIADLSSDFSIIEVDLPKEWNGKSLRDLNLRDRLGINIIAMKKGKDVLVNLQPDDELQEDCKLIIIGENSALAKFCNN